MELEMVAILLFRGLKPGAFLPPTLYSVLSGMDPPLPY